MKRFFAAVGVGLILGFAGSLVTAFAVGSYFAEELSLLVPTPVVNVALTVADKVQGYDEWTPPKATPRTPPETASPFQTPADPE